MFLSQKESLKEKYIVNLWWYILAHQLCPMYGYFVYWKELTLLQNWFCTIRLKSSRLAILIFLSFLMANIQFAKNFSLSIIWDHLGLQTLHSYSLIGSPELRVLWKYRVIKNMNKTTTFLLHPIVMIQHTIWPTASYLQVLNTFHQHN